MSEDEIINRLKKIISISDTAYFKNFELMYQDVDAIKYLLDLYKQEKEKNKFINEIKTIGTDDTIQVVLTKSQYSFLLNKSLNSVSKDKIRAKIKELEKQIIRGGINMSGTEEFAKNIEKFNNAMPKVEDIFKNKIEKFKELLEGGEK